MCSSRANRRATWRTPGIVTDAETAMPVVVDASVVLAWLMPDEQSDQAHALLANASSAGAQAPALLHYEVGNALAQAARRSRIVKAQHDAMLAAFFGLPVSIDAPEAAAITRATELANTLRLSVYDASYLELALRRDCPLASLDRALLAAARAAGVRSLER